MAASRASYWALMQYLRQQPAETAAITLALPQLEVVMGGCLPDTAVLPGFWARSIIAAGTWERCGFYARLDCTTRCVTFSRVLATVAVLQGVPAATALPG